MQIESYEFGHIRYYVYATEMPDYSRLTVNHMQVFVTAAQLPYVFRGFRDIRYY